MRQEQAAHIDELVRAAVSGRSERDAIIHASWRRCVDQHRLDPAVLREAQIVTHARLREHRDAIEEFLHTARFGLETLYRQIAGLNYVLLLTDAKGVTVDFIGDPTFDNHLQRAGLYLGADWNEPSMGTCAVGTCIATGEALTVHQTDHFDATHIPLTCTAAPVYDPAGRLAAILDISALRSPQPKQSQYLALQLVKSYAHKIETAHLLNSFREHWILKLSGSQEFADIDPEFVLAVDDGGCIVGFNSRIRELLTREIRLRRESGVTLLGRRFSEFFDCRLDDLPTFTRSLPPLQRTLRLTRSGTTLFAHTLAPPERLPRPAASDADTGLPAPLKDLYSGDPTMRSLAQRAAKLVNAQMSILVQGETGTGKEHVAKAIHAAGARSGKAFVAVNCAALPEGLIESELFGHDAGAFTGAAARGKRGLVLEADGGTLFLDEIGDMPLALQTRLLRVLAEREVTPVGRTRPVPVNIRVIAATHRDLLELIREGRFREDLYFRLNGAVLNLPRLRERVDLPWLAERMLAGRPGTNGRTRRLSPAALDVLRAYRWPGNIRELLNVLDFACAVAAGETIEVEDLPDMVREPEPRCRRPSTDVATGHGVVDGLTEALRSRHWNVSAVARDWGVDRTTIHRRMRRSGIVAPHKRD